MERLVLQGGTTPMRILAPTANVSNPQFSSVLFDANWATLRLWMTGAVTLPMLSTAVQDGPAWNDPARAAIPLGKVFTRPPITYAAYFASALGPFANGTTIPARYILACCAVSDDQTSSLGCGCASSTTTIYPLLFDRSLSGGSKTVHYGVYDRPSGA